MKGLLVGVLFLVGCVATDARPEDETEQAAAPAETELTRGADLDKPFPRDDPHGVFDVDDGEDDSTVDQDGFDGS